MKINWRSEDEKPKENKNVLAKITASTGANTLEQYIVLEYCDESWVVGFSGEEIDEYGWEVIKWTYLN